MSTLHITYSENYRYVIIVFCNAFIISTFLALLTWYIEVNPASYMARAFTASNYASYNSSSNSSITIKFILSRYWFNRLYMFHQESSLQKVTTKGAKDDYITFQIFNLRIFTETPESHLLWLRNIPVFYQCCFLL